MRIVILPTEVEASNFAADLITEFINNNNCLLYTSDAADE